MTDARAQAPLRVTVWGEGRHEVEDARVARLYPTGMHEVVADGIRGKSVV